MTGIENVIKELKWMRDKPTWQEGIMSYDDHAETRKRIINNTLELLREQEKRISRLTLENNLIHQNCQGLEEQRAAFAMKLEEMTAELKRAKKG